MRTFDDVFGFLAGKRFILGSLRAGGFSAPPSPDRGAGTRAVVAGRGADGRQSNRRPSGTGGLRVACGDSGYTPGWSFVTPAGVLLARPGVGASPAIRGGLFLKILVTGVAGFIGMHVALGLLRRGDRVVGIDNLNDYYEVSLKRARLARLTGQGDFRFLAMDIADRAAMSALFAAEGFERVVHLAAQAGVRYSLTNPDAYVDSNLVGFAAVLEGCRRQGVEHLVYASSSSVYGGNSRLPFTESDNVDHPVSLYAATKKANELMAHTYSHLYRLPTTGLRFFTVYGPWGRPDMAPFLFTRAILEGRPIDVFNHGHVRRDFTFIDDIAEAVLRVGDRAPRGDPAYDASAPDPASSDAPYRVFNVGNRQPVPLLEFIDCIERELGRRAEKRLLPMQPGDVPATFADTAALEKWIGFAPRTPLSEGIARFVDWYRAYYRA